MILNQKMIKSLEDVEPSYGAVNFSITENSYLHHTTILLSDKDESVIELLELALNDGYGLFYWASQNEDKRFQTFLNDLTVDLFCDTSIVKLSESLEILRAQNFDNNADDFRKRLVAKLNSLAVDLELIEGK